MEIIKLVFGILLTLGALVLFVLVADAAVLLLL